MHAHRYPCHPCLSISVRPPDLVVQTVRARAHGLRRLNGTLTGTRDSGHVTNSPLSATPHFPGSTAGTAPSHIYVGKVPVFDGSSAEAVDVCLSLIASRQGGRIATANLDFLALAGSDSELVDNLRRSSLVVADGMPVVWLAKLKGANRIQRTAGVDLVATICSRAEEIGGLRVAMFGSSPEVASSAARYLESLSPTVTIVATICPPFRELTLRELDGHGQEISSAQPDLVLVAMGCPVQERLIANWHRLAPSALWVGVGGTFDFFAGERKRAPRVFQMTGTEWVVRMVQDPRRLGRRYLGRDIPALLRIAPGCAFDRFRRSAR